MEPVDLTDWTEHVAIIGSIVSIPTPILFQCSCVFCSYTYLVIKSLFFYLQAKAARERLLMKSKQNMKPVLPMTAAALPNEDDIPSSSDNSDAE